MAIMSNLSTQIIMAIFFIITISLLSQNANSASITFPHFGPNTYGLKFEGDAFLSNGAIQLTKIGSYYNSPLPESAGRASYYAPIRLWDAKTGKIASFTTSFTFIVAPNSPNGLLGDGISFFIAPFQSRIPRNSTGGFLGLFNGKTALNSYKNKIVAVEFDSFGGNPWDPATPHIGIDVNSIASVKTEGWQTGNAVNGFTAIATVNYDAVSKTLSVFVRYPGSHVNGTSSSLSYVIDLRTVLPEWVRIGFSGATGKLVEALMYVNSIASIAITPWQTANSENGYFAKVLIFYEPATKNLSVLATYRHGAASTVSYIVDLRTVLPEWVRIGFSDATGGLV